MPWCPGIGFLIFLAKGEKMKESGGRRDHPGERGASVYLGMWLRTVGDQLAIHGVHEGGGGGTGRSSAGNSFPAVLERERTSSSSAFSQHHSLVHCMPYTDESLHSHLVIR